MKERAEYDKDVQALENDLKVMNLLLTIYLLLGMRICVGLLMPLSVLLKRRKMSCKMFLSRYGRRT